MISPMRNSLVIIKGQLLKLDLEHTDVWKDVVSARWTLQDVGFLNGYNRELGCEFRVKGCADLLTAGVLSCRYALVVVLQQLGWARACCRVLQVLCTDGVALRFSLSRR
ncbi:TPA: hypothetical protein ACH3X1_009637 [Trebouxia sp. C0004]